MAFSEFDLHRITKLVSSYVDRTRPPPAMRGELDVGFRVTGQSVELFQSQPVLLSPGKRLELPVAKFTYVKTQRIWKVYWHRQDLRWHRYEPNPEAKTIDACLGIVEKDEYACFWG